MKLSYLLNWLFPNKPAISQKLFIEVLKEYIEKYTLENALLPETKDHYDVYYRNISLFMATAKIRDLKITEVRIRHMEDLRLWLMSNLKTCTVTRASRHLELCKRVTAYCVMCEYMLNDPLTPLKGKRDKPKEVVYLEQDEIKKMMFYKFSNDFTQLAADLFIFQMATGVSYKDIYDHELTERLGYTIIMGNRKDDVRYEARVFKEGKDILNKYDGELPHLANQTYNRMLKEIALLLNIKKHLTTHVARKTHATLLAEHGVSTKSISLQLGNTERVAEKHYVGKSNKIVQREFERVGLGENLITLNSSGLVIVR